MRFARKHIIALDVQFVIDLDEIRKALDLVLNTRHICRRHILIEFLQKQIHAHRVHPRGNIIFLHQVFTRQLAITILEAERLRQSRLQIEQQAVFAASRQHMQTRTNR